MNPHSHEQFPDDQHTDWRRLEQQLLSATSGASLSNDDSDEETHSLHAAWRALHESLQSIETDVDEAGLIERALGDQTTVDPSSAAPRIARRALWWEAAVALASVAVLLLVASATWKLAWRSADAPAQVVEVPAPQTSPTADSTLDKLAWDDALDEQLASAEQAIVQTRLSWSSAGYALDAFDNRLDDLQQEIDQGSL